MVEEDFAVLTSHQLLLCSNGGGNERDMQRGREMRIVYIILVSKCENVSHIRYINDAGRIPQNGY
jgi:hypothetical protein